MELQKAIGEKIKQLRVQGGMSTRDLADRLGLSNHQAVLNLEKGERELKAHELSRLAKIFQVDMNDFFCVDKENDRPFVLWRSKPAKNAGEAEAKFIRVCRDYGLFEELLAVERDASPITFPKRLLDLQAFSRNDAYDLAEEIRARMNLGAYPAQILIRVLEDQYGIRFFSENLAGEGSAACTWFSGKPCLLLSATEPAWRQHFSVAHELFHLVTWDEGLFQQVEKDDSLKEKNEMLANAFAAGLLMPAEAVRAEVKRFSSAGALSFGALVAIARRFEVSLSACIFRLANLRILSQRDAQKLSEDPKLRSLDSQVNREETRTPYQFGATFLRLGYLCYESGKISRARLAKALDVSLVDLPVVLNMAGLAEVECEDRVEITHS